MKSGVDRKDGSRILEGGREEYLLIKIDFRATASLQLNFLLGVNKMPKKYTIKISHMKNIFNI